MSVDRKEVEHVAGLARVPLEPEEADRLRDEMNRILEHADRLRDAAVAVAGASRDVTQDSGEAGMRAPGADAPDPLVEGVETFAPALGAGFFLVPPPQGVSAGEDGE